MLMLQCPRTRPSADRRPTGSTTASNGQVLTDANLAIGLDRRRVLDDLPPIRARWRLIRTGGGLHARIFVLWLVYAGVNFSSVISCGHNCQAAGTYLALIKDTSKTVTEPLQEGSS
jgi:hypothetical protein